MDWEAIGAVGEIVGAAAVIATLVFLVRQIRHSSLQMANSTAWAVTQALLNTNQELSLSEELTHIWIKGRVGLDAPTAEEVVRYRNHAWSRLNVAFYIQGHLPEGVGHGYITQLRAVVAASEGFKEVVEEMKAGMAPQLYKALMAGT